jgi:hypothetical protein
MSFYVHHMDASDNPRVFHVDWSIATGLGVHREEWDWVLGRKCDVWGCQG